MIRRPWASDISIYSFLGIALTRGWMAETSKEVRDDQAHDASIFAPKSHIPDRKSFTVTVFGHF